MQRITRESGNKLIGRACHETSSRAASADLSKKMQLVLLHIVARSQVRTGRSGSLDFSGRYVFPTFEDFSFRFDFADDNASLFDRSV